MVNFSRICFTKLMAYIPRMEPSVIHVDSLWLRKYVLDIRGWYSLYNLVSTRELNLLYFRIALKSIMMLTVDWQVFDPQWIFWLDYLQRFFHSWKRFSTPRLTSWSPDSNFIDLNLETSLSQWLIWKFDVFQVGCSCFFSMFLSFFRN